MKKRFFILIIGLVLGLSGFGQTVQNTTGICLVSGDPNLVTDLDVINQYLECSVVKDSTNGVIYAYNGTLTVGSRWVAKGENFVNTNLSSSENRLHNFNGNDLRIIGVKTLQLDASDQFSMNSADDVSLTSDSILILKGDSIVQLMTIPSGEIRIVSPKIAMGSLVAEPDDYYWKLTDKTTGKGEWVTINPLDIGTTEGSVYIMPDSLLMTAEAITKSLSDSSITIKSGDVLIQNTKLQGIKNGVVIEGGALNGRYAAFPALWKTNEYLYAYYRDGSGHTTDGNTIFSRSNTNGLTWERFIVAENQEAPSEYGTANSAIYVNDEGRIFLSYYEAFGFSISTYDSIHSYTVYSDDFGSTWSTPEAVITPDSMYVLGQTHLREKDGRIFLPYYYERDAELDWHAGVAYSDDEDFTTWTYVDFPDAGTGTTDEASMIVNGDTLIAFIRTAATGYERITRSYSVDSGVTWSALVSVGLPTGHDIQNGAYPNCLLLPTGEVIIHARHTSSQYQMIMVSYDLGLNFTEFYTSTYNNGASMYMDFCLLSENKIGAVFSVDVPGDNAAMRFATIDIPNKSYVVIDSTGGYNFYRTGSLGSGFQAGDIAEISPDWKSHVDGYGFGKGLTENSLIDLGDDKALVWGNRTIGDFFIINSQEAIKRVCINKQLSEIGITSNKVLDIGGHIGAGVGLDLYLGDGAGDNVVTPTGVTLTGVNVAKNATILTNVDISGTNAGSAAGSISYTNIKGYGAGVAPVTSFSYCDIYGANSVSGTGWDANVSYLLSIGANNFRNGGGGNKIAIGEYAVRYHSGTNCIFIGNSLIAGSGHADNTVNNKFILGMGVDRLIEGWIDTGSVQLSILEFRNMSILPTGYTGNAGAFIWNGTNFQGHNGTSWFNIAEGINNFITTDQIQTGNRIHTLGGFSQTFNNAGLLTWDGSLRVNDGLYDSSGDVGTNTQKLTSTAIGTNWVDDTAASISFDNTASGLAAINVQTAIDENDSRVDDLEAIKDTIFVSMTHTDIGAAVANGYSLNVIPVSTNMVGKRLVNVTYTVADNTGATTTLACEIQIKNAGTFGSALFSTLITTGIYSNSITGNTTLSAGDLIFINKSSGAGWPDGFFATLEITD